MNENVKNIIKGVETFRKVNPKMFDKIKKYINVYLMSLIIAKTEGNYNISAKGFDGEIGTFQYMPSTLDYILNKYKSNFKDIAKTKELFIKNADSQAFIFCYSLYEYALLLEKNNDKLNQDYENYIELLPKHLVNYVRFGILHNQATATKSIATRFYPPLFYLNRVVITANEIYNLIYQSKTIQEEITKEQAEKVMTFSLQDNQIISSVIGFSIPGATLANFKIIKPVLDLLLIAGIFYIKNAFIFVKSKNSTKEIQPISLLDANIKTYLINKLNAIKDATEQTSEATQKTDTNVFKNVSEGTKEELKEIEKKENEQKKTDEKKNDNDSKLGPISVGIGGGVGFGLYKILNSIAESPLLMIALGVGAVTLLNNNKKQKR